MIFRHYIIFFIFFILLSKDYNDFWISYDS